MTDETCPWCGAEFDMKHYTTSWFKCGSTSRKSHGSERQSDLCKLRVAERRLSELDSELALAAETIQRQQARIAELEEALRRIGNINADGECYENPDNPQGCVRCRIALYIINTRKEAGGGE